MNSRLAKRHKRQVSRAKEKITLSVPDLRTPDQIKAARDASRPTGLFRHSFAPAVSDGAAAASEVKA